MRPLPILVVDPNPATARRVAEAFGAEPDAVTSARSEDSAMAETERAPPALALVAASLPGGNGYAVAARIRELSPETAVVLMTGGYEVYSQARADEAGAVAHLTKPFSAEGLRALAQGLVGELVHHDAEPLSAGSVTPLEPEPAPLGQHLEAPISQERIATFLPRTYEDLPVVAVDPEVVGPALERAVLEVLPEVVEAVLRQALTGSNAFRDLVAVAVEEAVADQLPAIATRVVEARLAELEAAAE